MNRDEGVQMVYYPVNLYLVGKKVIVIGGGTIAERKTFGLVEAGANVTIISPEITDKLDQYVTLGKIIWLKKIFSASDLLDAFLIIAATNDPYINLEVRKAAEANQLICLVDNPEESNFILPSVVDRGKLKISISTSGASPTLAKKIKNELSQQYGIEYKEYVDFLFSSRQWILKEIQDSALKQSLLSAIVEPDFLHSSDREEDLIRLLDKLRKNERTE